ncbi:hypothetical protein PMIN07_006409 [Paraphaeosphaeria minitans]
MWKLETDLQDLNFSTDSKGRVFKNPEVQKATDPAVLCASIMDSEAQEDTRILAVCGIPVEDSSSTEDGWLYSDFYAFQHLLEGVVANQVWIANASNRELVTGHKAFLHGNPFHDRKVVLNYDMVRKGFGDKVVEVREARAKNQHLLVLNFSHGFECGGGWWLGWSGNRSCLLSRKRFEELVAGDLDVTVVSTSCYGGQWCVDLDSRRTFLAAAGESVQSESWNGSKSVGRKCGGIFASNLLNTWREEAELAQSLQKEGKDAGASERTFKGFAGAVWDNLQKLDRFGMSHKIRTAAQDEDWDSGWSFLQSSETSPSKNSFANRSLKWTDEVGSYQEMLESKLHVSFGGNLSAARRQACALIELYMMSFPGRSSMASNTALQGRIDKIKKPSFEANWEVTTSVIQGVAFRLELAYMATQLMGTMGLKLPGGRTCNDVDMNEIEPHLEKKNPENWAWILSQTSDLLPQPMAELGQGVGWPKPWKFVAATLFMADGFKTRAEVLSEIAKAERILLENFSEKRKCLERIPEVRGRKKDWCDALKKRLRSLSPEKVSKRW